MENKKGQLVIISGPSGVGKGTICGIILSECKNIVKSISVTTRQPRAGEKDGVNYFFKTIEEYNEIKKSEGFLETFEIYGNFYGTPKKFVLDTISSGKSVLLEIDVQGALAIKSKMFEAKLVFLAPPSIEHLKERLIKRNTEDTASFNKRIESAKNEIELRNKYDYIVVNDSIASAAAEVKEILKKITN